jgi:hypothetical protein
MSRMYVIGDTDFGVIYLTFDPFKISVVPLKKVKTFKDGKRISLKEAFALLEQDALAAFRQFNGLKPGLGAEDLLHSRAVEFCHVRDIPSADDWKTRRHGRLAESAFAALAPEDDSEPHFLNASIMDD